MSVWYVEGWRLAWTPTLDHWRFLGTVWATSREAAVERARLVWPDETRLRVTHELDWRKR